VAIPLLIPFALFMAMVGVLAVHHSADMWLTPLLNRLARPQGSWLRRTAFLPLSLIARGLNAILRLVRSVLSHWAAAHLGGLTRWIHGLRTWTYLQHFTVAGLADDTLHALSWLRHHTLPHAIHVAVAPVRALARRAEHTAVRADRFAHALEKRFLHGIDRLAHRLAHFIRAQVHGIDRLIREHVLPRIRAVERAVTTTLPRRLSRVEARLKRLEKALGLGVIGAVVFRVLAKVAPWIFCRNVKKLGNTVCGMNPSQMNAVLSLLLGTLALADLRTFTKLAEEVTDEALDEVRRLLSV
jgi:hypothetical protein